MLNEGQLCRLVVRECVQAVREDAWGDPELLGQFMGTVRPCGVPAEGIYGDEAARRFGADLVFNPRRLAAGVPVLDVDELVRDGAAPFILLEPAIQPDYSHPIGATRLAVGHTNPCDVNVT